MQEEEGGGFRLVLGHWGSGTGTTEVGILDTGSGSGDCPAYSAFLDLEAETGAVDVRLAAVVWVHHGSTYVAR